MPPKSNNKVSVRYKSVRDGHMKRKLIVLLAFSIMGFGRCDAPCFDPRPDYCGFTGKTATVVTVNHRPIIVSSK